MLFSCLTLSSHIFPELIFCQSYVVIFGEDLKTCEEAWLKRFSPWRPSVSTRIWSQFSATTGYLSCLVFTSGCHWYSGYLCLVAMEVTCVTSCNQVVEASWTPPSAWSLTMWRRWIVWPTRAPITRMWRTVCWQRTPFKKPVSLKVRNTVSEVPCGISWGSSVCHYNDMSLCIVYWYIPR